MFTVTTKLEVGRSTQDVRRHDHRVLGLNVGAILVSCRGFCTSVDERLIIAPFYAGTQHHCLLLPTLTDLMLPFDVELSIVACDALGVYRVESAAGLTTFQLQDEFLMDLLRAILVHIASQFCALTKGELRRIRKGKYHFTAYPLSYGVDLWQWLTSKILSRDTG